MTCLLNHQISIESILIHLLASCFYNTTTATGSILLFYRLILSIRDDTRWKAYFCFTVIIFGLIPFPEATYSYYHTYICPGIKASWCIEKTSNLTVSCTQIKISKSWQDSENNEELSTNFCCVQQVFSKQASIFHFLIILHAKFDILTFLAIKRLSGELMNRMQ